MNAAEKFTVRSCSILRIIFRSTIIAHLDNIFINANKMTLLKTSDKATKRKQIH